jgi:hypothetical protein
MSRVQRIARWLFFTDFERSILRECLAKKESDSARRMAYEIDAAVKAKQ